MYIYIYTIVNRNIKEPTGPIYSVWHISPTTGQLYNRREVIQPHQSSFTSTGPYIIPGMTSRTCAVTESLHIYIYIYIYMYIYTYIYIFVCVRNMYIYTTMRCIRKGSCVILGGLSIIGHGM